MASYTFTHVSNANFTTRIELTNAGVGTVNWAAYFIRSSTAWTSWNINTVTNRPSFSFALGGVGFSGFYTYDFRLASAGLEKLMGSGSISVPAGSTLSLTGTNDPKGSMGIATASGTFTTQAAPPPPTPVWSTGTTLTNAVRGTAYSATVTASPVTSYSVVGQSADTRGLSASGNIISGTPTSNGTVTFTIRANNSGSTADRTFSILIDPPAPVFSDQTITTPWIKTRNFSTATDRTVAASDAASYSIVASGSGLNPTGWLSINGSGQLSGLPTTQGVYTFRVRATNSIFQSTDSNIITLTVNPPGNRVTDPGSTLDLTVGKRFDGVNWIDISTFKRFDGTNWVDVVN